MFQECVIEMFQEMFGEDAVPKMFKGDKLYVDVAGKRAHIDLNSMVNSRVFILFLDIFIIYIFYDFCYVY